MGWAKFFSLDLIRFCKSLSPFSRPLVQNRFLSRRPSLIFILNCLAHIYIWGTSSTYFPPQIKCISFAVRNKFVFQLYFTYTVVAGDVDAIFPLRTLTAVVNQRWSLSQLVFSQTGGSLGSPQSPWL